MDYSFKKVLPEDVFVSALPVLSTSQGSEEENSTFEQCPNKLSGVEFMDVFARAVWQHMHADASCYATKMQIPTDHLHKVVMTLSGISFAQWCDRYVNMAAIELLEHSMLPIGEVGQRLGFNSPQVFSKYFYKHNNRSPKEFRYAVRGFNNNPIRIMKYKLKQYEANEAKDTTPSE